MTIQILSHGYVQNGQCAILSLKERRKKKSKENQGTVTLTSVV